MKKVKLIITFLLLSIVVGLAAVVTDLAISGATSIAKNPDDFNVYFSSVDGAEIIGERELAFDIRLEGPWSFHYVYFTVTNASKNYDAEISMTCTGINTEYTAGGPTLQKSVIEARGTSQGYIEIGTLKSYAGEEELVYDATCTLTANAVERDTLSTGSVSDPVNPYYIGREVSIGEEKFNVISSDDTTVTMLAQYNLGTDYRQTITENYVIFSETNGWEYTPGPKEIDIQEWSTNPKTYVNEYVEFLKVQTGDNTIKGNLITLFELEKLECSIPEDYSYDENSSYRTCKNTPYEWLNNNQLTWTRSASLGPEKIWYLGLSENVNITHMQSLCGIRPTITVSKDTYKLLLFNRSYEVGEEITIGEEKFNVISDNGTTISMFAKYNLSTDYKQSKTANLVTFSDTNGWEYTPGPKEIDIQNYEGNTKNYVNEYVAYLKTITKANTLTGSLITIKELKELGCTMKDNYSWIDEPSERFCSESAYKSWLATSQSWWTKSVVTGTTYSVWYYNGGGYLNANTYNVGTHGIRPVITISKEALEL